MRKIKFTQAVRRKIIQVTACIFANASAENFLSGKLYTGDLKKFCVPGLNCYSCPAANFSCPLGAIQAATSSATLSFSFYATGIILAFGVLIGRAVCGFLCPFGLIQEFFYKVPSKKFNLWRKLIYIKYFLLIIFVLLIPELAVNFAGIGVPAFCQYICPAGTLEAGLILLATHREFFEVLGALFALKIFLLAVTVLGSVICYRFFCKVLCPLGAIYGILNKISFYHLQVDKSKCINCGACKKICRMNVNPVRQTDSAECILCGDCKNVCPRGAIKISN